jgi:hypothetical protein
MKGDIMKYQIIKNDLDDYTLSYKDKVFNYKSDVELISKLQNSPKKARIKMLTDLANEGISLKRFTIEEKKDGKTYYDNTNKNELERTYIGEAMLEVIDETCKKNFNLTFGELMADIGLETQEEQEKFSSELGSSLMGKFPSR